MNVTLSVDDEIVRRARQRAEALGTSINQLIRDYLKELAGSSDQEREAAGFARLLRESKGNSEGWKFNRDELYERK